MLNRVESVPTFLSSPERVRSGRLVVNIGDATLLTSLHSISEGNTTLLIDPSEGVTQSLIEELANGRQVFSFLHDSGSELWRRYASISMRVLGDVNRNKQMYTAYLQAWEKAKSKIDLLYHLPVKVEALVDSLKGQIIPVADEVTYHYPSPQFDPRFAVLDLAASILKRDGVLKVTTENSEVSAWFAHWGGDFTQSSSFIPRKRGDRYVSAYDIAWGEAGHFETIIRNTGGELPRYMKAMKSTLGFRLQNKLNLIK